MPSARPRKSPQRRRPSDCQPARFRSVSAGIDGGGTSGSSAVQDSICSPVISAWNWIPQTREPSRNACVQTGLRASSTAPAGRPYV